MPESRDGRSPQSSSAVEPRPASEGGLDLESAPTVVRGSQRVGSGGSGERLRPGVEDLTGVQLGPYLIEAHIGSGGMGTVFRARDVRLNRYVALKVLPREFEEDPTAVRRFQYEAQWAARLDHENIARVFDVGSDKGYHYIAFEYVDGRSVRDLLAERGRLDQTEVVRIALQVVSALCHAAARGVVHRDIKPSNLIITRSGRVKLVDMGLARTFERRGVASLTETGMTLGTFDYIAPEQARDPRTADVRSDIYSLGCTLFHMLTGRPPYLEDNPVQKLLRHQNDPPPNVLDYVPDVNRNLARVLHRMMQKDPADRYQTPEELLDDLVDVAAELNLKPVSTESVLWIRRRWSDRTTALLIGVWATLVIAFVGFLFLFRYPEYWQGESAPELTTSPPLAGGTTGAAAQGQAAAQAQTSPELPAAQTSEAAAPPSTTSAPSAAGQSDAQQMTWRVATAEELRDALARCPDGAVIELVTEQNRVIELPADGRGEQAGFVGLRVRNKSVTIRPASGRYPVLRLRVSEDAPDAEEWALFELHDAALNLEHITLELAGAAPTRTPFFFICSGSDVRLNDTVLVDSIRWDETSDGEPRTVAFLTEPLVHLPLSPTGEGTNGRPVGSQLEALTRPTRLRLARSLVGPVHIFAVVTGPTEISLEHTTLAWVRRGVLGSAAGFVPSTAPVLDIALEHCALHVADGTAFELLQYESATPDQVPARIQVRNTILANVATGTATLLAADAVSQFRWRGDGNDFRGFERFLVRHTADGAETGVKVEAASLLDWEQLEAVVERGPITSMDPPWTWQLLVSSPFNLTSGTGRLSLMGAPPDNRVGPRYLPPWRNDFTSPTADIVVSAVSTRVNAERTAKSVTSQLEPGQPQRTPATDSASPEQQEPRTSTTAGGSSQIVIVDPEDESAFDSLTDALAVARDGTVVVLRVDGPITCDPVTISNSKITIRADTGHRPVLELHPLALTSSTPGAGFFNVRNGTLVLSGVDIELQFDRGTPTTTAAAFSVFNGQLELNDCRAFVSGSNAAIFDMPSLRPPSMAALQQMQTSDTPTSELARNHLVANNCILVTPGFVMRASRTVEVDATFSNCALLSLGPLVKPVSAPGGSGELKLEFSNCSVRAQGGLIDRPTNGIEHPSPRIRVTANNNLFQVAEGTPLITVVVEELPLSSNEPLLQWKGSGNAYDAGDEWLVIRQGSTQRVLDRVSMEEFDRPPYREETDSRSVSLQFKEPLDQLAQSLRAEARLFELSTAPPDEAAGADLSRLPH